MKLSNAIIIIASLVVLGIIIVAVVYLEKNAPDKPDKPKLVEAGYDNYGLHTQQDMDVWNYYTAQFTDETNNMVYNFPDDFIETDIPKEINVSKNVKCYYTSNNRYLMCLEYNSSVMTVNIANAMDYYVEEVNTQDNDLLVNFNQDVQ